MKKIDISNYNTLLFFIIRGNYLGICSENLYIISKQDSWISMIIACILGIIPLLIYYFITKKYPDKNILEIIQTVFGKVLGKIINIIMMIFIFIYASSIFYNLIIFIATQYLYNTPLLAIACIFGLCFYFLINKGINTVAKTSTILFYAFCFLFILTSLGLITQIDISNVLPINEYGIGSILNGSFHIISLNIAPLFLMLLIPYNKIKENKKFIKNSFIFYVISMLTIFLINFSVLSIYGSNIARLFQYPEFHLLKRLSLIGFIERVENILSIQWIFEMVIIIAISLCYIKENIKYYLKKDYYKNNLIDLIIIIISIISVLNIFKTTITASNFYLNILPILNSMFFIIIPFIILILSLKKKTCL